jgi:inositol transport system ATP-binding protein
MEKGMAQNNVLEVKHISKSFPGVQALDDVSFSVKAGSVHVLCGENGAGKSTLMKIINGIYQPDRGETFIRGERVEIESPIKAGELGISMIFQELNYMPEMSIEESLFVGRWPKKSFRRIDWKTIRETTLQLLKQEGLHFDPETKLKELSISNLQMLEILKAISRDADIIIMDEPTSSITNKEIETLFQKIAELRARGKAIVYISHKMDEIFQIADEISVLRDGKVVETRPKDQFDIDSVIALMVGRALRQGYPKEDVPHGDVVLEVEHFSGPGGFNDVSFNLKEGEIVGFAGLVGAGRTETVRALFGLDEHTHGVIKVRGRPYKLKTVQDSIRSGIVMLSEDRRRFGIVPVRDVKENVALASMEQFFQNGHLYKTKERNKVKEICGRINVKMASIDVTVSTLSGGNQQKVVLSKWMLRDPEILILDEPTRGIDVGAKFEIYKLMTNLVKEGKSIIMVSSELSELIGMCDRIYVMSEGQIAGELGKAEFSQEKIMRYAMNIGTAG